MASGTSARGSAGEGLSSRESAAAAGWEGCAIRSHWMLMPEDDEGRPVRGFSWLDPRPLWDSRNEVVARMLGDPTSEQRASLMRAIGSRPDRLLIEGPDKESLAFLIMGDTGEGDGSQYAVVPSLLSKAKGTSFLFLCSDLVYPAGGIEEYGRKVLDPYRGYTEGPIYGIPGNHDWYDNAEGFAYWFCGLRRRPSGPRHVPLSRGWWRNRLWRHSPRASAAELERLKKRYGEARTGPQPGPYFAIDAGPLRLVALDTGLGGPLDREQGEWLRKISRGRRPKILLSGKPLYVNGRRRPRPIEGGGTVDLVVADEQNNYIAAIGGDVHNYQRYLVTLRDGRRIPYIVSGGGGAFMHATHKIPSLDGSRLPGVREEDFRCYPLRGDSLARFSRLYARRLGMLGRGLRVPPREAPRIMADRCETEATRPEDRDRKVRKRSRKAAARVSALPGRVPGVLHLPFAELLDWDDPPLFRHFLRVDASEATVDIRCYAVTGCAGLEESPPLEDHLRCTLQAKGRWEWTSDPDSTAEAAPRGGPSAS